MFYVPPVCAHGLQTLVDDMEVCYQLAGIYNADTAKGLSWNDLAFGIEMPLAVSVINQRDRDYPDF
jgi:dTDP-4-dehydrorhamnose 3,5-epimerase